MNGELPSLIRKFDSILKHDKLTEYDYKLISLLSKIISIYHTTASRSFDTSTEVHNLLTHRFKEMLKDGVSNPDEKKSLSLILDAASSNIRDTSKLLEEFIQTSDALEVFIDEYIKSRDNTP
ncbi:hypothetical protein [Comamonas sp. C11]|uniref:hypothetical protein n=1 Tax=Comamonas sp. C11 TaxID=2966554 RepID=UPI00211278BE|nr:hypothetical protein [Comamonas sp. C11]UUC95461.1 hypothetical protein NOX35_09290 [Comamonas sp. C11]